MADETDEIEITEVFFECGKGSCQHEYILTALPGEKIIPVCPECRSTTHQQVCG